MKKKNQHTICRQGGEVPSFRYFIPVARGWPSFHHLYNNATVQMRYCTSIGLVALIYRTLVNVNMLWTDTVHHILHVACDSLVPSNNNQVIQLILGIMCLKIGRCWKSSSPHSLTRRPTRTFWYTFWSTIWVMHWYKSTDIFLFNATDTKIRVHFA